jgi:nucleoporin NUP42
MQLLFFHKTIYLTFPANCRFEHPPSEAPSSNPFAAPANTNRFGALSGGKNDNDKEMANPYKITKENIQIDLTDERPFWILSSYGPGKDAPEQLFGGYPREQSFEEARLFVMTHANQQQAVQQFQQLYQQAESQIQATLNNLDGAVQFIMAAENRHPNRRDICKQGSQSLPANPLNASASANPNPFSAPTPNPFGAPSTTAMSTFGQPSAPASAFGQPSATPSAFGQPSALGKPGGFGTPAFGQPSMPGATEGSAFGAPSKLGATPSAFGQPSALGAKPNPFSAPAGPSGFAQAASQPPSAFGAPSAMGARPSPFSQAQAPAQATQPANPFASMNGTGQPARINPFNQATSTTGAAASDQAMDTAEPPSATANPFARPSGGGFAAQPAQSKVGGFGAPAVPSGFSQPQPGMGVSPEQNDPYAPGSAKQHPPLSSYSTRDMAGKLSTWKGEPVFYKDDKPGVRNADGSWRKIWFPDGPPAYYGGTEPQNPAEYTSEIKAIYERALKTGRFEGNMPSVPPMREDITWDF